MMATTESTTSPSGVGASASVIRPSSMFDSSARSLMRRPSRSRVAKDDLEEPPRVLRLLERPLEQGLEIALDGGQRRAELVRTFATNSVRTPSSRRSSVTSWSTMTTPRSSPPSASGTA